MKSHSHLFTYFHTNKSMKHLMRCASWCLCMLARENNKHMFSIFLFHFAKFQKAHFLPLAKLTKHNISRIFPIIILIPSDSDDASLVQVITTSSPEWMANENKPIWSNFKITEDKVTILEGSHNIPNTIQLDNKNISVNFLHNANNIKCLK